MIQSPVTAPKPDKVVPANISVQPNYNAVKIDIHNPQVNAGIKTNTPQKSVDSPIYSYPQAPVYDVPKASVYSPEKADKKEPEAPKAKEVPTVPAPVVVKPLDEPAPTVTAPTAAPAKTEVKEEAKAEAKKPEVTDPKPSAAALTQDTKTETAVEPKKIEIKQPEDIKPQVDFNAYLAKLNDKDFDVQANTMEEIANLAQTQPKKASELLDVKVIDTLIGIMNSDSSKLEGPTPKQLEIRDKIIHGKKVSEAENAEANKITPMELAERNKQFAIYTVAILQKLYGSEVEKLSDTTVPLTELPGAAAIVEQVKTNPNPMVRASGIDALSYIQRPEYKQDLATIFSIAQNDQDAQVKTAATKALDKLAKIEAPAEAKKQEAASVAK